VLCPGSIDERQRSVEHTRCIRRHEHHGIPDRLHKPHRLGDGLERQLFQAPSNRAEFVEWKLLAFPREPDEVGKAHRDASGTRKAPGVALCLIDDLGPRHRAQLQTHHLAQERLGQRHQTLGRLRELDRKLILAHPGSQHQLQRGPPHHLRDWGQAAGDQLHHLKRVRIRQDKLPITRADARKLKVSRTEHRVVERRYRRPAARIDASWKSNPSPDSSAISLTLYCEPPPTRRSAPNSTTTPPLDRLLKIPDRDPSACKRASRRSRPTFPRPRDRRATPTTRSQPPRSPTLSLPTAIQHEPSRMAKPLTADTLLADGGRAPGLRIRLDRAARPALAIAWLRHSALAETLTIHGP
jgi:hypothetical protein